ncbi:hypothetical protein QFZ55_000057 [Streptomyces luteogriseus]|nr:hypothetical protein [Streptomyces luteogriseus]
MAGQRCVQFSEKDIGQRRALTVFEDLFSDLGQLDVGVLGDLLQHREAVARGYLAQDGQDADGLVDDGVRGEGLLQLPVLRPQPFQLFHQLIGRH